MRACTCINIYGSEIKYWHTYLYTCALILCWRLPLFSSLFFFSFFFSLSHSTHYNNCSFVCLNFAISCLIVMITSAVYSLCVCACFFYSSCHFMKFCTIHLCCYCCRRFVCFVVSLLVFLSFLQFSVSFVRRRYVFFLHSLLSLFDGRPKTLFGDSLNFWHKICYQQIISICLERIREMNLLTMEIIQSIYRIH